MSNYKQKIALNAKNEKGWWLWTPKLRRNGGFECWNWERGSGSECWDLWGDDGVALNAKLKQWLWMPSGNNGFECQAKTTTLNAKWKQRLWTPNCNEMVAVNAQLWTDIYECQAERDESERYNWEDMVALNVELKMQGDDEREICPSVVCCHNSQSTRRV